MKTQAGNSRCEATQPVPNPLSFKSVKSSTSPKRGRDLRAVSYLLTTRDKSDKVEQPEINDDDQNNVYWKGYN
mgnify:CR=1 FL=1